jgi:hypothetical protein
MADSSRGLSAAIPPDTAHKNPPTPEGSHDPIPQGMAESSRGLSAAIPPGHGTQEPADPEGVARTPAEVSRNGSWPSSCCGGASLAHSARFSGTPSGCRIDFNRCPEVSALLRPPATVWQPFRVADPHPAGMAESSRGLSAAIPPGHGTQEPADPEGVARTPAEVSRNGSWPSSCCGGASLAHSARFSGTPSGCRIDFNRCPEVSALLRPPATVWQPFRVAFPPSRQGWQRVAGG